MRRPTFKTWARAEILDRAQTTSFNLRKLAMRAQRSPERGMAAPLLLYAHECGRVDQLLRYVHTDALRAEFLKVEHSLGSRSVERLALRGKPLKALPHAYRDVLAAFEAAYHAPERLAAAKREMLELAREATAANALTPTELARALGLDAGNMHAFLERGDVGRFTYETTVAIADFAISAPGGDSF